MSDRLFSIRCRLGFLLRALRRDKPKRTARDLPEVRTALVLADGVGEAMGDAVAAACAALLDAGIDDRSLDVMLRVGASTMAETARQARSQMQRLGIR